MTTPAVDHHRTVKDPWPTLDDALEAARLIAEQAQAMYGDLLDSVWLYGSLARADHRPDSDLDLLLITTTKEADPVNDLRRRLREKLTMEHFEPEMWAFLSLADRLFGTTHGVGHHVLPQRPRRRRARQMTSTEEAFKLLADANERLAHAEANLRIGIHGPAVTMAYYSALYAAQAVAAYHIT